MRKVDLRRWLDADLRPEWLGDEDIPADPLCSFDTKQNIMSVWILDNGERTVEEIAAALAVQHGQIRELGYVILDSDDIAMSCIETSAVEGNTLDSEANKLHHDLNKISAQRLVTLTRLTLARKIETVCERVLAKEVATHILRGISNGSLPRERISPKILADAEKLVTRRNR